jgi:predicted DNA-binding transcriptional regulator AlpA
MQPKHSPAAYNAATITKAGEVPAALQKFDFLPDAALVSVKVVAGLFSCAENTVWYRVKHGKLPAPLKVGAQTRWRVGDLRAVISCPQEADHAAA